MKRRLKGASPALYAASDLLLTPCIAVAAMQRERMFKKLPRQVSDLSIAQRRSSSGSPARGAGGAAGFGSTVAGTLFGATGLGTFSARAAVTATERAAGSSRAGFTCAELLGAALSIAAAGLATGGEVT